MPLFQLQPAEHVHCCLLSPGHKNAVLEVHWTPDGERLVSCSPDKTVRAA